VTTWRFGERLVRTQALAQMKRPQNQARFPRSFNCMRNIETKFTAAITWRNFNVCLVLSGDERDRTANLLVAN
jgi:hypothetical protein